MSDLSAKITAGRFDTDVAVIGGEKGSGCPRKKDARACERLEAGQRSGHPSGRIFRGGQQWTAITTTWNR